MDMRSFLEKMIRDFHDRGTIHMATYCEDLLSDPPDDFLNLIEEIKQKRSSCEKFSVEFQYYWSLLTYVEDMQFHYSISKE